MQTKDYSDASRWIPSAVRSRKERRAAMMLIHGTLFPEINSKICCSFKITWDFDHTSHYFSETILSLFSNYCHSKNTFEIIDIILLHKNISSSRTINYCTPSVVPLLGQPFVLPSSTIHREAKRVLSIWTLIEPEDRTRRWARLVEESWGGSPLR